MYAHADDWTKAHGDKQRAVGGGTKRGRGGTKGGWVGGEGTDHQGSSATVHLKAGSWEHRAVTVAPPYE